VTASWTDRLWAEAEGTYRAIVGHPFLTGLTDGSLDEDRFAYYIAQDVYYLRDYARALAILAAKAPTHADTGLFARHAAETVAVELALHERLLADLGLDSSRVESTPVSPTTTAYTSYLLAVTYGGTFAAGLATVLPCYWIYQRAGGALVAQGSPNPRYQQWINTYAGDAFAATVAEVLVVADRVGSTLDAAEHAHARCHFATTARYEWMFWDAAWRRETWPILRQPPDIMSTSRPIHTTVNCQIIWFWRRFRAGGAC